ncbi:hypothetical protein Acor_43110 [Acrocarpospora corrugata]|uniref:Uncharacterized protein n=1 Tax=Acrocarpospora corrugata TaxID=35763 RepID=A0A5M3W0D1_9ACTN|nr:hypothetical protein Acor_43110 [Acrocarpospora corrugata]
MGQRRRWRGEGEVVGWECWSGWAPWVRSLVHTRIWSSYKPGTDPPPEATLRVHREQPFPLDPNSVLWITESLWITTQSNQPAAKPTRTPADIQLSTAVEKVIHKPLRDLASAKHHLLVSPHVARRKDSRRPTDLVSARPLDRYAKATERSGWASS